MPAQFVLQELRPSAVALMMLLLVAVLQQNRQATLQSIAAGLGKWKRCA